MFIDNKYTNWYYQIINNAQHRGKLTEYYELHHIIPKSLGGLNDSTNLIELTAREHFICHLLLTKMVTKSYKYKMQKAANMMSYVIGPGQERYKTTSRIYKILKEQIEVPEHVKLKMSASQKTRFKNKSGTFLGRTHSEETKELLRKTQLGKKDSLETKKNKSIAAKKKPKVTDETCAKISASNKGRRGLVGEQNGFFGKHHSEEQRAKKRKEKLESPKKTCYHCNAEVDAMNYGRWHGDKCKQKT